MPTARWETTIGAVKSTVRRSERRTVVVAAVGSRGDVQPCLVLGLALESRGHIVFVATEERQRGLVEEFGLSWRKIEGDLGRVSPRSPQPLKWEEKFDRQSILRSYETACKGADLIVGGPHCLSATVSMAQKLGARWCSLMNDPTWPTAEFPLPSESSVVRAFACLNRRSHTRAFAAAWRAEAESVNRWRRGDLGLEAWTDGPLALIEKRKAPVVIAASTLVCGPRRRAPADFPGHVSVAGFLCSPVPLEVGEQLRSFMGSAKSGEAAAPDNTASLKQVDVRPIVYFGLEAMPATDAAQCVELAAAPRARRRACARVPTSREQSLPRVPAARPPARPGPRPREKCSARYEKRAGPAGAPRGAAARRRGRGACVKRPPACPRLTAVDLSQPATRSRYSAVLPAGAGAGIDAAERSTPGAGTIAVAGPCAAPEFRTTPTPSHLGKRARHVATGATPHAASSSARSSPRCCSPRVDKRSPRLRQPRRTATAPQTRAVLAANHATIAGPSGPASSQQQLNPSHEASIQAKGSASAPAAGEEALAPPRSRKISSARSMLRAMHARCENCGPRLMAWRWHLAEYAKRAPPLEARRLRRAEVRLAKWLA